jgi:hypothetical protein
LSVVVGVAIALRVWLWAWGASSSVVPPGDPEEYYRAALHMLHGGYHDTGKWLRPPAYPTLLALLLALAGMNVAQALVLQAALLGVGCLAFYAYGRQVFGRNDVGLLAALLAATFVPLAAFASAMYAEALFVCLMLLMLAVLDRALVFRSWKLAFAAGALIGVVALTRAVGLFFLPIAVFALLLPSARTSHAEHEGAPFNVQRSTRMLLALLLGATLVIGPWAARNYAVHQRLILVDTNGGISVWFGQVRSPEEKAARDAELFAVPNLADRQTLALRWTAERIAEAPAEFVGRMRFKIASLLLLQTRSYAAGDLISLGSDGRVVVQNAGELPLGLALLADAQYVAVMLLGIAGASFAPHVRRVLPTLLCVVAAVGLAAVSIGHPRLRLPVVTALIPLAAYALLHLPAAWRGRSRLVHDRRMLAALGGGALFVLLIGSPRYVTFGRAEWLAWQAQQRLAVEDSHGARALFERAQQIDPANPLRSIALADLALRDGRIAEAHAQYAAALEREWRNQYAHAMRAHTARRLGDEAGARAALAAIEGYWRAGNDLYTWAWHALPDPAATRVVPGDPLALGQYKGFAPATPDLSMGRWTLGDGQVRLAPTCDNITLMVRGPTGRYLTAGVVGAAAQTARLNGEAQELRLPGNRPGCATMPAVVRVQSATGLLDLERAPWYVGVAVVEVVAR